MKERKLSQFKACITKEWLELTRTSKLFIYILIPSICLLASNPWLFGGLPNGDSVVFFNSIMAVVFTAFYLFNIYSTAVEDSCKKRLALPISIGLKPTTNLTAKYLMNCLLPVLIILIFAVINSLLSGIVFQGFNTLGLNASIALAIAILFCGAMLLSFATILKGSFLGLVVTIIIEFAGGQTMRIFGATDTFPNGLFQYAINLKTPMSNTNFGFYLATVISFCALVIIATYLVVSDRHDKVCE